VDPWVAAWQRVLRDLDDEPAHAELVALCARHGRLPYALDAYRRLESLRPGDARVSARLAQVARTIAAVGELPQRSATREGRALRTVGWWVVAMLVALVCAAVVATVRRALDDEARPTAPPAASAPASSAAPGP
jgi:DNA-binding SARP family transcriptional activator